MALERLELMLSRATNAANEELDIPALDAFASIILEDEINLSIPATKLIVVKIHSSNVKESLLALDVSILFPHLPVSTHIDFVLSICIAVPRRMYGLLWYQIHTRSW